MNYHPQKQRYLLKQAQLRAERAIREKKKKQSKNQDTPARIPASSDQ